MPVASRIFAFIQHVFLHFTPFARKRILFAHPLKLRFQHFLKAIKKHYLLCDCGIGETILLGKQFSRIDRLCTMSSAMLLLYVPRIICAWRR
jgi:hypothetical protein